MKKFFVICLFPLLLSCLLKASAGSAGSPSDPIVSLSYLNGVFYDTLKSDLFNTIETKIAQDKNRILSRLDDIYRLYIGYRLAPQFTELSLDEDNKVYLASGASFVLLDGSAEVSVSSGAVVNVTTGYEVSPISLLVPNNRYFCTEETTAVIKALSESFGLVEGLFTTDGIIDPNKTVFSDVKRYDWFFPAIDFVYNNGLFAGTSEDTFSPSLPMTRAMFVTVLHRLEGNPLPVLLDSFSDVTDPDAYFYKPVAWAAETGVVAGYEDGSFLPDLSISREQMALIIYRYAAYKNIVLSPQFPGVFESFPDSSSVSDYALDALIWATENTIINGSDGLLLPHGTASRAHVAQIILNLCNLITQ